VPYHADLSLTLPFGLEMPGHEGALITTARTMVPKSLANADLALISLKGIDTLTSGLEEA
jgi:hypothetical protein